MDKIIKQLSVVYYLCLLGGAVVAALLGYWLAVGRGIHIDERSSSGIVMTSCVIIYVILSIPGALGLSHLRARRMKLQPNTYEKVQAYRRMSVIRMVVIAVGLWAGIIVFYLLNSNSMLYCAGMAAIAVFFCKPSEAKMRDEIEQLDEAGND